MSRGTGARERRCPNCGALVGSDASWCGQCFFDLEAHRDRPAGEAEPPTARDETEPTPTAPIERPARTKEATWPCPACGEENPIEEDVCSACGTPFSALFKETSGDRQVEPRKALIRSLEFPGLGHAALGRGGDALARGTMFVMVIGLAAIVVSTHPSSLADAVLVLYVVAALAIYGFSAIEAFRLAQGESPWLTTRQLLWAVVGIVIVSVMLLAGAIIGAPRGG